MKESTGITVEQAKLLRKESQEKIELVQALERLYTNKDFNKLFMEEYLEKEPARLVHLLGEPAFNNHDKKSFYREDLQERMIGIARFAEYLRNIYMMADTARKNINALDEAESEINSIN
jgi:hypothetical protein